MRYRSFHRIRLFPFLSACLLFLIITSLLLPNNADALLAETGATLHWDTLAIGGINATVAFEEDWPFASADNNVDPKILDSSLGLVEGEEHLAYAEVAGAKGIGRTYSTGLEGYALTTRAGEADPLHHIATGSGERELLITPLETGTITFDFDYTSTIRLITDKPGDEAFGWSYYNFNVFTQTPDLLFSDSFSAFWKTVKDGADYTPPTQNGHHAFSYTFDNLEPLCFDLEAATWSEITSTASSTPVPEPSSLLMLGPCLFWFFARKRNLFEK